MDIDLNCDLGEGAAFDAQLMPFITSANIACGAHAGDAETAAAALRLAKEHEVHAGAHPGFFDREHFGRRDLVRTEQQIYDDCIYQVSALIGLARSVGLALHYIKPHGALYNLACRDDAYARPLIAVAQFFQLPMLGLPHSRLQALCGRQTPFIAEGFADRRYRLDGSLVPRSEPGAFVENPEEAVRQVFQLVQQHGVRTLCVHGDNPQAVVFVRELRTAMTQAGFTLRAFA